MPSSAQGYGKAFIIKGGFCGEEEFIVTLRGRWRDPHKVGRRLVGEASPLERGGWVLEAH